jgi:hypothetical protein
MRNKTFVLFDFFKHAVCASYNHDRPNMGLGGFTPKQHLAKACINLLFLASVKMWGHYPGWQA